MPPPVFRFAPSPNGYLHLGHAYSALLNYDLARRSGGRLLLRIEDIDTVRYRPEFEAAIYEDLAWLGIVWEEPVRRQSRHFADYRAAIEQHPMAARITMIEGSSVDDDVVSEVRRHVGGAPGPYYGPRRWGVAKR